MELGGIGSIVDSFAFEGGQLAEAEYSTHRLLNAKPKLPQGCPSLLRRGYVSRLVLPAVRHTSPRHAAENAG